MNFSVIQILILAKCSSLFAAITDGFEKQERQSRIVGGKQAVPHSHPYLVSLRTRVLWMSVHDCGGALLNRYWILSAGHCAHGHWLTKWLPMDAVAGAHHVQNIEPEAQVVSVSQRIIHPQYKGGFGPHDIAVLKASHPFTLTNEIQPVRLPKVPKEVSHSLALAGWGALKTTYFLPDDPDTLQEVSVMQIPFDVCYNAIEAIQKAGERNPLVKEANICTGPLTGGISACSGDSGGPLVQFTTRQQYYNTERKRTNKEKNEHDHDKIAVVLGVATWTFEPCGLKGAPTVYTKVSNYLDFINLYKTQL